MKERARGTKTSPTENVTMSRIKIPKKQAKQRPSEAEKPKYAKETTKSANRRQSDQQKRIATEFWMGLVGKKQVENRARKLRSGSIDKTTKLKKNKKKA